MQPRGRQEKTGKNRLPVPISDSGDFSGGKTMSVSSADAKLFNSSFNGDIDGVNAALAQGGRVAMRTPQGPTPLLIAARNGHTDICGLLLRHGSSVNGRDHNALTPLSLAAYYGHTDICGLLLAHGSNVNEMKPDNKVTALHYAASQGHHTSVEALLSWGAKINPQDRSGFTPLLAACQKGHLLCVQTLLNSV